MEYLKLNLMNSRGYSKALGKPKGFMRAVALTSDGQVVFGTNKISRSLGQRYKKNLGFDLYDDEVERQRKLLADSVLAQLVLEYPRFVDPAVKKVSQAIKEYWDVKKQNFNQDGYQSIVIGSWKYLYSDTSFGSLDGGQFQGVFSKYSKWNQALNDIRSAKGGLRRDPNSQKHKTLLTQAKKDLSDAQKTVIQNEMQKLKSLIDSWMAVINETPLDIPKTMNLHDHFKRLFERILGPANLPLGPRKGNEQLWANSPIFKRLVEIEHKVRPKWYEDRALRGRVSSYSYTNLKNQKINVTIKPVSTSMPGLITQDFTIPTKPAFARCGLKWTQLKTESHIQGRSRYVMDATKLEDTFRKVLAQHNLPFSASASGTTSTLFMSARMFANLSQMEDLKQYLLACVAYLVGGGMHTTHEVFWTGKLLDIPYTPGKYIDTLPNSFKKSLAYRKWLAEFYDVARPDRKSAM